MKGGGGGGTWVKFCWACAAGLSMPQPIRVYSVAKYRQILVAVEQICNYRDPNLVTFYFYELTHFLIE